MKAVENFLKLKSELQSERTNATQLEAELRRLQGEYPVLESQFIEAEDPKVSAEIEKKMVQVKNRIEELPVLIKKSRRRCELLEQKLNRAEEEAIRELRTLYFPKLNGVVKKLIERWRGVAEVEKEIRELQERARLDLLKITGAPRILLPSVPVFFTEPDENAVGVGEFGPYYPFTRLKKLVEALAREGLDVSFKDID